MLWQFHHLEGGIVQPHPYTHYPSLQEHKCTMASQYPQSKILCLLPNPEENTKLFPHKVCLFFKVQGTLFPSKDVRIQ